MASAYGMRKSRVVVFPTAIFISLHDGNQERVTLAEGPTQNLRLDQIGDIYQLGGLAEQGKIAPQLGQEQLSAILRKGSPHAKATIVLGHTILAVGLAMVLAPYFANLLAAAVLGTIIGVLKVLNRDQPVLEVPLPVVAATIVSSLVFLGVKQGIAVDPLHALVPPLVTFLPGAMLTLGMVELAYGDMVSGSSRLITGLIELVLLCFGLVAGAMLVGYTPENLVDMHSEVRFGPLANLAQWVGVLVFGVGVYLHFSAPANSLFWMLFVLLIAYGAQQVAALHFSKAVSGFFGMLIATPLGYLIQLRFNGPPAMVTFLPTFWMLVPGALGLMSIKHMLSDREAGIDGMITTVFVFASIALGTLMGASLYKSLSERFGTWQMQIGRVGRFFRPGKK
jgi:uncharacterized membrane protein YjjP (DUF1212 family)